MMQIKSVTIPHISRLKKSADRFDYADSYCIESSDTKQLGLHQSIIQSMRYNPWWIKVLLIIRKILVLPFGLKNDNQSINNNLEFVIGKKISVFNIEYADDKEVILFYDDKHLNCWLSFLVFPDSGKQTLTMSTVVTFYNFLGRAYFFLIKPFHVYIVKKTLKEIIKKQNLAS